MSFELKNLLFSFHFNFVYKKMLTAKLQIKNLLYVYKNKRI